MKTATHTSKRGKGLYKRSEERPVQIKGTYHTQFYDVHCNKWRESEMLECDLVAINPEAATHKGLFTGELTYSKFDTFSGEYCISDNNFHFIDVHDVLAHDDGKAEQRAKYICEAVNMRIRGDNIGSERLLCVLEEISEATCIGEVGDILREHGDLLAKAVTPVTE